MLIRPSSFLVKKGYETWSCNFSSSNKLGIKHCYTHTSNSFRMNKEQKPPSKPEINYSTTIITTSGLNICLEFDHAFRNFAEYCLAILIIYRSYSVCIIIFRIIFSFPYCHSYSGRLRELGWISLFWHSEHWAEIKLCQNRSADIAMLCFN